MYTPPTEPSPASQAAAETEAGAEAKAEAEVKEAEAKEAEALSAAQKRLLADEAPQEAAPPQPPQEEGEAEAAEAAEADEALPQEEGEAEAEAELEPAGAFVTDVSGTAHEQIDEAVKSTMGRLPGASAEGGQPSDDVIAEHLLGSTAARALCARLAATADGAASKLCSSICQRAC